MNIQNALKNFILPTPTQSDICSALIRDEITKPAPSLIARFGSNEIKAILYPKLPLGMRSLFRTRILESMETYAGFFPSTPTTIKRFSELMYEDMTILDILGSWRIEELFLRRHFSNAALVALSDLEPYLATNPWSEALKGRKVIVVHPFSTTIERQYHEKRNFLFCDKRVLPEFKSLETIKAIQSIAGNRDIYQDWFTGLDSMKAAMDEKDYDIAILGCGAYGFPLAAHAKRRGKKAIHLGGATQILFGIKGRRWEDHPLISKMFNQHWVRPAVEDVPNNANKIENGCYW